MKQRNIPYIGAAYELLNRIMFIFSMVTQLIILRLGFYNQNDSIYIEYFKNFWFFLSFLFLICWIFGYLLWAYVIPSQNSFQQKEAIKEGRSPTFELIMKVFNLLLEIKKDINEIKSR